MSGSLIPRYVGIAGAYSPEDTTYQTNQHTHTIPKSALLSCSEESSFLAFLFACFNGILRKNVYHHVYNGDTSFSFYLMIGTLMLCQSNTNRAPRWRLNALHMAAWHGCSVPVFGRILDKIKDVNAGNNQNRTAITIALAEKHLDLVESLLKVEGIDVNISDNVTGKNALHWASTRLCSPYLYKQILDKINNVNAKTAYPPKGFGKTALMLAVSYDLRDMVILLLEHPDILINIRDEVNKFTALHFAVSYDRRYILLHG